MPARLPASGSACRYLMPSLQPYGGPGWALSCLLPPSAISLFASVLVKHEAVQQASQAACLPSSHPASQLSTQLRDRAPGACQGAIGSMSLPLCVRVCLSAGSLCAALPAAPAVQGLTWRTLSMPVTVEHSFRWAAKWAAEQSKAFCREPHSAGLSSKASGRDTCTSPEVHCETLTTGSAASSPHAPLPACLPARLPAYPLPACLPTRLPIAPVQRRHCLLHAAAGPSAVWSPALVSGQGAVGGGLSKCCTALLLPK